MSKILEALKLITDGLKSISLIKRDPRIIEEVAEKKDIKNQVRKKRSERKILRIQKRIEKLRKK